jgi:hypothetical protein
MGIIQQENAPSSRETICSNTPWHSALFAVALCSTARTDARVRGIAAVTELSAGPPFRSTESEKCQYVTLTYRSTLGIEVGSN